MTFNMLAIVVVLAMVVGAVGVAVFDGLLSGGSNDKPLTVDPAESDPVEQQYRDKIAKDPNDVAAMSALANYLGNTGKIEEAITWYEKALTITPDDMDLRLDFASALASGGKMRDSELQYKKVVAAQPQNAFAMLGLARLYRSWSPPRLTEAVTFYQQAIDAAGDSVVRDVAREELSAITGTPVASPGASPSPAP
ncbi:MAG TPA: tetratricopeptide repeat protein [Thermomicrobiales bacterium]|jgi:cytochrome c-type biogenesis protein CcmH/NrfG|nr:tetratricopeptide repeat protein [Thermomicrobiales bacterium]